MPEPGGYVVFDLETQNSFDDVGGRDHLVALKVSIGVTWSSAGGKFHRYDEESVHQLVAELQAAPLIVGYNVLNFDYGVLAAYTPVRLRALPTCDLLDHLHRTLGFRVKLDDVAAATLGTHKTGDGLDAIRWWRAGEIERLYRYCEQDVDVTRQLFEFGRAQKYVQFADRRSGRMRKVPVSW